MSSCLTFIKDYDRNDSTQNIVLVVTVGTVIATYIIIMVR